MTKSEAHRLVMGLCATYPSQVAKLDKNQLRTMAAIYAKCLVDLEFTATAKAVERLAKSSRWMPTIADIRAEVGEVCHGQRRAGGEAWGDVLRAVGRHGHNRTPGVDFQFDDPLVADCVGHLGWTEICRSEIQAADRARFIELYDQLARGERKLAQISPGGTTPKLRGADGGPAALPVAEVLRALTEGTP